MTTTTTTQAPKRVKVDEPKQVYIYIRVSSKGQNAPEYGRVGMDTQNMEVLKFCMANNLYVKSCITEVGSAYHTATPKLTKLIEKIKPGMPIMVYSFNRFSRNVAHAKAMVQAVHAKGSYIWSVMDQMTSENSGFMSLVQAAENESRLLGQRISSAHQRIRTQGGFVGRKPFGYNKIRVDGVFKLQENRIEQAIMKKIRDLSKIHPPTKVLAIAMKKYHRYQWNISLIHQVIYDSIRQSYPIIPSGETGMMESMIEAIDEVEEETIDTTDVYVVKKLHKIRVFRGVYEVLVQWEGFTKCTWENVVSLHEDVPEMVQEFLESSTSTLVTGARALLQ
jgi:DNA invertase Pin-like site-specific DNA recombinase